MSKILHIIIFIALNSCTERQKMVQQKVSSFYVVKYEHGKSDTLWVNGIPDVSDKMIVVDSFTCSIHQKSIQILRLINSDTPVDGKVVVYFEKSLGFFEVKSKTWSLKYQLRSTDDSVEACIDKIQNLDFVK